MSRARRLAFTFVLFAFSASPIFAARVAPTGKSVPNEVLIKIRANASANDVDGLAKALDADQSQRLAKLGSGTLMRLRSRSKNTAALEKALAHNPHVEFVEPNHILSLAAEPNDPAYSTLWGLENTGQPIDGAPGNAGADIDAEAAWAVTTGSASVVIGVVDTGIDYTHPDLAANMWTNPGGKGNAACAAGTFGFNAITGTCNPMDDHSHGTHVAGTIGAAGNNGIGIAGVNWTASIMALKFINASGWGTMADAVTAIDFAIQAKIDGVNVRVLSNSWGSDDFSKALLDIINKANEHDILFVAAAGNDGYSNDSYPQYPASYTTPNMISVAATDNRDHLAWFTNFGATTVHLAAPGVSTYSTIPGGGYGYKSGTSMATPHVAGVAALVLAAFPSLTTAELKSAILDSTDPLSNLTGKCTTGGRLNAAKAVGGTPAPDFSIAISPAARTVTVGGVTTYTLTVNPQNGFTGAVTLSVSGLPAGATASITPETATTTATLAVATTGSTPTGASTLQITGTSGSSTRTAWAALTTAARPTPGECPSFSTVVGPYAPTLSAVAIADINGDGKSDYISASTSSNSVQVRYGPSFSSLRTLAVGKAPLFVATGDFNGDGKVDLASANSLSHNVSVLLTNAAGGFEPAVHYAAGTSPFALATGDFNRDGRLDLAAANNGSSSVSILLGQSGGTFAAATHFAAGASPFWVTAADVDADGRTDLAVANYNAGTVSLLRGNGDGSFDAPLPATAGTKPSSVTAGDFDGDGRLDLATSNYGANSASLLTGNGDGTFDAPVHFAVRAKPTSIAAADLDGDGRLDLVTASGNTLSISILLGNGSGSFAAEIAMYLGYEPIQAQIGDLDNDGRPDILVAASGYVLYVFNRSTCALNCGVLAPAVDSSVGSNPDSVASGDFNADGRTDLAIVDNASNAIAIRLGNGDGTFTTGDTVAAGTSPHGIIAGDFDRDGHLDLAVASTGSNEITILPGNGDGTWQSAIAYAAGTAPRAVATGDFDRDGRLDLAVAARDANAVTVLFGGGDGTFQAPVSYDAGTNPEAVAVADFNRDAVPDLAVANAGSANVSVLLGNANGTFQAAVSFAAGTTPRGLIARDLDGDGDADLAVANAGSNDVSFFAGNGSGGFAAAVQFPAGTAPYALLAADLNADGRLDLVTANNTSHDVSVLLAIEAGSWSAATNSATGLGPSALASADFNRDGRTDMAVVNGAAATFSTLLNTCPVPDLTVTKTHEGTFSQGAPGAYTITVSNVGAQATNAPVTVKDTLPQGLAATAMSGTGWTCVAATTTCVRSDALAPGASYPPITLTVRVYGNAPLAVTNTVTVSGGGEVLATNDTASDPTTIAAKTDLLLLKTHTGSFAQGATGRTYSLTVRNSGGLASSGAVTVTDTLPAGLTAVAMAGVGWSCNVGSLSCTRSDALAPNSNYPTITVVVNVAENAPSLVINTATLTGGGDDSPANNTASDPTVVWSTNTCGAFAAPAYYSMATPGGSLAVADFNNDGRPDVAVGGGYYTNNISVRLGAGDGTLLAPVQYPAPYSNHLAVVDLDRDGNLDLVSVTGGHDTRVSVLSGLGDGTFAAAVHYDAGNDLSYADGVSIADVDQDGNPDVITGSGDYSTSAIVILSGNGDGTLRAPISVAVPSNVYAWTMSDVDGDVIPDLLLSTSDTLHVMPGNGDATFRTAITLPLPVAVASMTTGDFNGDGIADIAGAAYNDLLILVGNGDGTFVVDGLYVISWSSSYVTTADINADGKLDVLTGGYTISTLLGNGDGTFQTAATYYAYDSNHIAVTDLNGDGRADLVYSNSGEVNVRLGGCPDLAITKTHYGSFTGGRTGQYTIRVANAGGGAAAGTVTVTDTLPEGMTVSSYSAYSWNCTLAGNTLTCTRTGTLSNEGSYWEISIYVHVSPTAPTSVTNVATLTADGDTNSANNTASDPTTIVHAPDLVVNKTHAGVWTPGQTGTYTISVGNIGTASTTGTVTVTDSLPGGMTRVSMSGTGWACNFLTCTRSDALAPTSLYPPITLTVTVGGSSAYNNVYVQGGGETYTSNNSDSDYTTILQPPSGVVATATSASQIAVTWTIGYWEVPAAYEVFRSTANGPYVKVGTTFGIAFYDTSVAPNTVYLYKVRVLEGEVAGPFSAADLANTIVHTDDPVVARTTPIKRVHIEQLRAAVNQTRAAVGLAATTFTDPSLAGILIRKIHITELRNAINEARAQIGKSAYAFSDSTSMYAVHINDLRAAMK